jgi:signal peptidase I
MSRLIKEIGELILAFLLAFITYRVLAFTLATPIPIVSVTSNSMIPTLHPGDFVIVISPNEIKKGDIIIYEARCAALPREDIIHRVIKINGTTLITKGDNNRTNPVPDPCPVSIDQVKGKVLIAVPLLGYPRLFLNYLFDI